MELDLTCPISKDFILDPVIAEDGYIYERKFIKEWLRENNTSPVTREDIGNKLIRPKQILNYIKSKISENKELQKYQKEFKTMHIEKYILSGEFQELLGIDEFDYSTWETSYAISFFENCKDVAIAKHVIDHFKDINIKRKDGPCMIFSIIKNQPDEIIHHLLDKKPNIKVFNGTGYRTPLHFAFQHAKMNIAERLIKEGCNPYERDHNSITPLDLLLALNNYDNILLFINKFPNLYFDRKSIKYLQENRLLTLTQKSELTELLKRKN